MRIRKICLKPPFSHSKCVLQAILSLTILSNCVYVRSNFDTAVLADCTKYCVVFSCYWTLDRKFNEDSKNVPKTVSFSLQVGFTGDFVSLLFFQILFLALQNLTLLFSLPVPNFVVFFHVSG